MKRKVVGLFKDSSLDVGGGAAAAVIDSQKPPLKDSPTTSLESKKVKTLTNAF
jgi:hypothetical protein